MTTQIKYKTGCAVNNIEQGILCNMCNDIGRWGRGFPKKLSQRWKDPEEKYKYTFKYRVHDSCLGTVQFVPVSEAPKVIVANCVTVHGKLSKYNPRPFHVENLRYCFERVYREAVQEKLPVVFQELPADIWLRTELLIKQYFCNNGIQVVVYRNPEGKKKQ